MELSSPTPLPAGPTPQLQQVAQGSVWASWGIPVLPCDAPLDGRATLCSYSSSLKADVAEQRLPRGVQY